jgi:uncharacterized protein YjiS (DUF1127 family)
MNRMGSTFEVGGTGRSPAFETYADVERHIARAHRLRGEVTAQLLGAAFQRTAGAVRALGVRAANWQRQRRTYDLLMRCSDRTLADIGIAREDIALIARGIDPGQGRRSANVIRRKWSEMGANLRAAPARLDRARRGQREWRRAYRELMAYTDREFDELGIRRADIGVIVSGGRPASWIAE